MSDTPTLKRLTIQRVLMELTDENDHAKFDLDKATIENGATLLLNSTAFENFVKRRANAMIDATNKLMEL